MTRGSLRSDLDLFRQRRFTALFGARTVSVFGNVLGPIGLSFGVLGLPGGGPVTLSAVLAAMLVPRLGLLLIGGLIGDRLPRYRVLVGAELLSAAAYGALAAMLLTQRAPVVGLVLAAALAGAASAVLLPSLTGVVPEVVGRQRLTAANALLRLGTNTATITGLVSAGLLVTVAGPGWALAVDAATYLASAALLASLRLPVATRSSGRSALADLRDGWAEFAGRPWLVGMVGAAAFVNAGTRATFGLAGPVVAAARLSGAGGWAAVMTAYSAGMIAGVAVALRLRPRRPLAAAAGAASLLALPALALGSRSPLLVVLVAAFVAGVAGDVFGVLWSTTFQREIPPEALSRVSSYEWLGALSLGPVGMAVAGPLIAAHGAEPTLLGIAAVVAFAPLATLCIGEVRALQPAPAPEGTTT